VNAVLEQRGRLPVKPLCEALGVSRATVDRQRRPPVRTTPRPRCAARKLTEEEKARVVQALCSERFVDRSPAEALYTLLDEGKYLCSERTMYRVLTEHGAVKERRAQRSHPQHARPELVAAAPNEAWSWDITRLRTTVKWSYLYLYVLLDLFSRYVVGWMIARAENAAFAKLLIEESIIKHGVEPGTLVLHSDRGAPMTSKTLAQLLAELDVARSFSRPHTSNDNPFSESHFKTAKYHPSYPGRFATLEDALDWGRAFFRWYNHEHKHSSIAYLTPADVYCGRAEQRLAHRHAVLQAAYAEHPERFPHGAPQRQVLPPATYLNPPSRDAQAPMISPVIDDDAASSRLMLAPAEAQ
jgi:putative transposase